MAWAILSWSRACVAPGLVGSWGFEYFGTSLTVRGAMHASVPARDSHTSYISGYKQAGVSTTKDERAGGDRGRRSGAERPRGWARVGP